MSTNLQRRVATDSLCFLLEGMRGPLELDDDAIVEVLRKLAAVYTRQPWIVARTCDRTGVQAVRDLPDLPS